MTPHPLTRLGLFVVACILLPAPAFAVIDDIDADVTAEIREFAAGTLTNSDQAFESLDESTSQLPLIVQANLFAEDDDDTGLAGGVAVTVFNDPSTSGSPDPDAFGLTAAAFSPQADLSYLVTSNAVERRRITFTAPEIGEPDATPLDARSFFFIDGLIILWADADQTSLDATRAEVHFTVDRTSDASVVSDTLLTASLTLTGRPDGTAQLTAAGVLTADNVVVIDLTGSVPGLSSVHVVYIPDSAIAYDYDAVVGEPFNLQAAIEARVDNAFHTGAAVILGVSLDQLLQLVNDLTGQDVADAFGTSLTSVVLTGPPPLKPLPTEGETTVAVANPSARSLFGCGTLGAEAALLLLAVPLFHLIARAKARRPSSPVMTHGGSNGRDSNVWPPPPESPPRPLSLSANPPARRRTPMKRLPYEPPVSATDTPRILAIDDVRLEAQPGHAAALDDFYAALIGLDRVDAPRPDACIAFRGWPRSGPRLIVTLVPAPADRPPRRRAAIQVASLYQFADRLLDRRLPFDWTRGWFPCDRRLILHDPAGHRIELAAYHRL